MQALPWWVLAKIFLIIFKRVSRYRYHFADGRAFAASNEIVIGAQVAKSLHYQVGQSIVLAHGLGDVSFHHHDDHPLLITGILTPTGTPVDHALFTSLQALKQAHDSSPKSLKRPSQNTHTHKHEHEHDHDIVSVDVSFTRPR